MLRSQTEGPERPQALQFPVPYPSSWVEPLIARIDRLPGPAWAFYLLVSLAVIIASHLLRWLDGTIPAGAIDPARVTEAPLLWYGLALMHYLNSTARRSMEAFRPALAVEEDVVPLLAYRLTTIPRTPGFIALAAGIVLGVASFVGDPASYGAPPPSSTLTVAYSGLFAIVSSSFVLAFVIHTVRQLRQVSRIHGMARNINLFQRTPVYAFSALTARTGVGIVIVVYYFVYIFFVIRLFGQDFNPSPIDLAMIAILLLLAAASFVLPLNGMHNRLAKEKARMEADADHRFEAALHRLHERLDRDNLEEMDELNKALGSLVIEREALAKLSTWPWKPETLRGFLTSVALPLLLWLVTVLLGRFLGV